MFDTRSITRNDTLSPRSLIKLDYCWLSCPKHYAVKVPPRCLIDPLGLSCRPLPHGLKTLACRARDLLRRRHIETRLRSEDRRTEAGV